MTSPEWEAANEDDSDRFPQTSHTSASESTESHERGSRVVPDSPLRVMVVANPDEALIEAIAEVAAKHSSASSKNLGYYRTEVTCACGETYWGGDHDGDPDLHMEAARHEARAAHDAMVAHLGLVEERAREIGPGVNRPMRRLVSRWTEVDHGRE